MRNTDGFYIGRYEVGDGDLTTSFRGSSSGYLHTPVSMQGKAPYNYITWYQSYDLCKEFAGTNESVNSCLIYGCLWDATLEYLVEVGDKTYSEVGSNSSSWGNYFLVSFNYTNISGTTVTKSTNSILTPTGATDRNSACNIYDLAGNMYEWTQENSSNGYGMYSRGGSIYQQRLVISIKFPLRQPIYEYQRQLYRFSCYTLHEMSYICCDWNYVVSNYVEYCDEFC